MNLPAEIFGSVIVVHTPEELGADQIGEFSGYMDSVERSQVVLDLDHTEMFDSAGLTAVLDAQDRLRQRGGAVKIATTNATIRKILEITRLEQHLEIFDSVIDAVKSFQ
jgi:anti-anti-sigma factor